MKKILTILVLAISLVNCSNDDTVIIINNSLDADGDGVVTTQEEIDNTDPNNPCDYNPENQTYVITTAEWKSLDCDGDGVTNSEELDPDGVPEPYPTDPFDDCSLNFYRINYSITSEEWKNKDCDGDGVLNKFEVDPNGDGQFGPDPTDPVFDCSFNFDVLNYSITSEEWKNKDCDGDGVINRFEIDPDGDGQNNYNGTNPLDFCDFNISDQTLSPYYTWYPLDCDNDCRTNSQEIQDQTDPTDGTDFLGNGEIFSKSTYSNRTVIIDQDGTRLKQVNIGNGIEVDFQYDSNNHLIYVQYNNGDSVQFEYINDKISKVITTINSQTSEKLVEYQGNFIITRTDNDPPGLFHEKYEIHPTLGVIVNGEKYSVGYYNYLWKYADIIVEYENNYENLTLYKELYFDYNSDTGEYIPSNTFPVSKNSFSYPTEESEMALNPYASVINNIYYNFILAPDILSRITIPAYSASSVYLLDSFYLVGNGYGYGVDYTVNCKLPNNMAYDIYKFSLDNEGNLLFLYE